MPRRERRELVRDLARIKVETGELSGRMVAAECRKWGRSDQTVRRAIADVIAQPDLPDDPGLSDQVLFLVAGDVTNLYKAHSEAVARGLYLKSYPTFHREWAKQSLAVKIGLQFGKDAMRKGMETRVFTVPYRNKVVFLDEMIVNIPCRHGKSVFEQIYLLAFLDACSGEVLVWSVLDSPTTADDTVALFAALIYGREDADGVIHGGIPEVVITDNAAAFTSDLFSEFARRFCRLEFGRPYTPQDKAKIERKFWTIQYSTLAGTIGTTLGPKEPGKKRRKNRSDSDDPPVYVEGQTKHWLVDRSSLPTFDEASAAVNRAVIAANALPARLTKVSPSQKWAADTTIIHTANPILLWDVMVDVGQHKIDPRGIWYHGRWYRNSTSEPIRDHLTTKTLPGIDDRVFVGTLPPSATSNLTHYLAALVPNSDEVVGQSEAISIHNKADAAKVDRIFRGAAANAKVRDTCLPSVDTPARPPQSSKPKAKRASTTRRKEAPLDLALLVTGSVDLNGPVEDEEVA